MNYAGIAFDLAMVAFVVYVIIRTYWTERTCAVEPEVFHVETE
jgi:hypothetical protein